LVPLRCCAVAAGWTQMTLEEIATARKTLANFSCLMCGYTGPLAYGADGVPQCQSCQSGSFAYLLPNCPECGAEIGCCGPQTETLSFTCPRCARSWTEA
jgi:NAD-dependent SIR2 family protein deacetylase